MVHDIMVSLETTPQLTEVQARQIFDKMGDEPYHNLIEDSIMGGESGAFTPTTMFLDIKRREPGDSGYPCNDDRLKGMEVETEWYLDAELGKMDIEVTRLDVQQL